MDCIIKPFIIYNAIDNILNKTISYIYINFITELSSFFHFNIKLNKYAIFLVNILFDCFWHCLMMTFY